ncbi:MAG: Oxidoreductase, partial [Parcubacteria group bacterium GW2011_GWA1_47_8]
MDIKQSLGLIFKGELLDDDAARAARANDASIFEVMPKLVVRPKDADDIKALVCFVTEHHQKDPSLSITARAAGTGMAGGALTESIVLDVGNLNAIKKVTGEYAVLEPGVFFRDFEKTTLAINRIMPTFPASKNLCAVGGMVGTNASGEKTLTYGSTDHYVRNLNVVLSDGNEYSFGPISKAELDEKMKLQTFEGEIYRKTYDLIEKNYDAIQATRPRVSKNSTGYALWKVWDRKTFDLTKLFVGSEGTLGITTEITFGLVEPEAESKLLVVFVKDLAKLPEIVSTVLSHKPASFESFDDNTFKFAVRFFPDIVKSMKAGIISLGWSFLPEFLMVLTGGVPKLILLAEFTGRDKQDVENRARATEQDLVKFGLKMHLA